MIEFLSMNGYAAFVWPAYGVTALVTLGLVWLTVAERAAAQARLRSLQARAAEDSLDPEQGLPRGDPHEPTEGDV